MRDPDLWRRLLRVRFDDPDGLDLPRIMRRSRRWRRAHTQDVIEEYRRFLYLTQVATGEVAPSLAVDRMWEQHVEAAGAHYARLCRYKLRAPLERPHFLSDGERGVVYAERYALTRMHYDREFGTPPPEAIWPDPSQPDGARLPWLTLIGIVLLAHSCSHAFRIGRPESLFDWFSVFAVALVVLPYLLPRRRRGKGLTPAQASRRMRRIWEQGDGSGDGGGGGDGGAGGGE